jgi:hypothetical protein
VTEMKVGRETRYSLQPDPLLELKQWLSYYERYWGNKLAALKQFVEAEHPDDYKPTGPNLVENTEQDK